MTTMHTTFDPTRGYPRRHAGTLRRAWPVASADGLGLVGFAALCAIPLVIGVSAVSAGEQWYAGLDRPSFAPSASSLGLVWALTGAALAWSTWLVWRQDAAPDHERRRALGVFGARLLLGTLWAPLFFVAHAPDLGLLALAVHWLSVLGLISTYAPVSRWAAAANVPHLLWLTYLAVVDAAVLLRA